MNKKLKFTALVNPFTRTAWISALVNGCQYENELTFEELDEWTSMEMGGMVFDVHMQYDERFYIHIYDIVDEHVDYGVSYPVRIKFKLDES